MISEILSKNNNKSKNNIKHKSNVYDFLPTSMRDFINSGSDNLGLNKSIILSSVLCSISGMIGKRVSITSPNGYKILPSLYSMNVAPSGSNKSSSIDYAISKLEEINQDKVHNYSERYGVYRDKMIEYNTSPKGSKPSKPIRPMANYYLMGNYTWQALSSGLNYKNRHGVLIRNDEIESLLDRVTNNTNQDEKSLLLSALTNGSFTKETKGEEIPENISKLCLSILGSIQDTVADKYYNKDDGSGMLVRFQLFTHTDSKFIKMKKTNNDNSIEHGIRVKNHNNRIEKISKLPNIFDVTHGGLLVGEECKLQYSEKSSDMIIDFYNNFIRSEECKERKIIVKEYIRKMIYTVQSISLCLHVYEFGTSTKIVNEDTTKSAIECTKFFL